jgi:hypothetical protein
MSQPPATSNPFASLPKYRAPQEHGRSLVTPLLANALRTLPSAVAGSGAGSIADCGVASGSLAGPAPASLRFGNWTLAELRQLARGEAYRAAVAYSSRYRDNLPSVFQSAGPGSSSLTGAGGAEQARWLVAGHQPELFHPGVWFKNFLLSAVGEAYGWLPLNLVIDNDLCRSTGIKVPTRDAAGDARLRQAPVLFDAPSAAIPWECRSRIDADCFHTFPQRVRATLLEGLPAPLLEELWPLADAALRRSGRLGWALSEGRHALEAQLGLSTLELPLSQLCGQAAFARFSLAILDQLERFQLAYNTQRGLYRQANRIRNAAHPVPALSARAGWLEAPWWIYRYSSPARRRLFVRRQGKDLLLSDLGGWQTVIEGPLESDDAAAQWQELALDDVLIRPRALITTMFVRMVLSDLFVHGIGGGKYDQITDAIIQDFWGCAPPAMCVATATLLLPILDDAPQSIQAASVMNPVAGHSSGRHPAVDSPAGKQPAAVSPAQHTAATDVEPRAQLRQLRYHAEACIEAPDSETQQLIDRKRQLLQAIPPRGEKWQWHREMTRINQRLAEITEGQQRLAEEAAQRRAAAERDRKLARWREYSFCLFELHNVSGELKRMAARAVNPPTGK